MRKNDVVLCDLGALADGYCSDLTRTFFLGTMSSLGRKVFETVARAQRLAIEAALQLTGDNRASAAEILGLSRQSLYSKLHRHGLGNLVADQD